jgi:DNA polymerase-3 subunit epsilon
VLSYRVEVLAHNAPFDRAVLRACCAAHGLEMPAVPFVCTVRLARSAWAIRPTRLPDVCGRLGIALRHHDPLSDAMACARIAATALAEGDVVTGALLRR